MKIVSPMEIPSKNAIMDDGKEEGVRIAAGDTLLPVSASCESGTSTWTSDSEGDEGESGQSCEGRDSKTPENIIQSPKGEKLTLAMGKRMAKRPRECAICGRPANCCHFDVPSCLGCRSFFRRSILGQRQYICKKGGSNCKIGQGNLCRACRFNRCILVGMNIGVIRVIPDNVDLQKMSRNLEKRRRQLEERGANDHRDIIENLPSHGFGHAEMHLLDSLLILDEKLLRIRYSQTELSENVYRAKGMRAVLDDEHGQNLLAIADQFSEKKKIPKSQEYFVTELAKGHHWVKEPNWLHIDSFLCLQMAKAIPGIQALSIRDKIALMGANALAAVTFGQSFYSQVMASNEIIVFPTGFTPICFKFSSLTNKLFCTYMKPFQRMALTRPEFLLLRILILLQTASADLSVEGHKMVQAELEKYSALLVHHERSRFGDQFGWAQRYAELMLFVEWAMRVGNDHRSFLLYFIAIAAHADCRQHPDFSHPEFVDDIILGIGSTKQ